MRIRPLSIALTIFSVSIGMPGQVSQQVSTSETKTYSESVAHNNDFSDLRSTKKVGKQKKEDRKPESAQGAAIETSRTLSLPFSVFDRNGKFVDGLTAKEVEVYVDDQKLDVIELAPVSTQSDVVFLIDASPSIESTIESVKAFVAHIIAGLRKDDRVSIVKFNLSTKVLVEASTDRAAVDKALKKIEYNGGTSLYDAVDAVSLAAEAGKGTRPRAVVLLSDGVDTTSRRSTAIESLLSAARSDSVFFVVYVDTYQNNLNAQKNLPKVFANIPSIGRLGNAQPIRKEDYDQGKVYLNHLLRTTGGRAFLFPAAEADLAGVGQAIAREITNRYTAKVDVSKMRPSTELSRVRVRVNRPGLTIRSRSAYRHID